MDENGGLMLKTGSVFAQAPKAKVLLQKNKVEYF